MAWSNSQRTASAKITATAEWRRKVKATLRRDGYECQLRTRGVCIGEASEVDKIESAAEIEARGGTPREIMRDDNLRAVCVPCHRRRTGQQGAAASAKKRAERPATGRKRIHPADVYAGRVQP